MDMLKVYPDELALGIATDEAHATCGELGPAVEGGILATKPLNEEFG